MPLAGVERIEAYFGGKAYGRHRHDTYAIGITQRGVQSFHYRGGLVRSLPGHTMVLHPDEPHDGQAGTEEGFGYRMAYVAPALLQQALGGRALPFIAGGVSTHPALQRAALALLQEDYPLRDELAWYEALSDMASALQDAAGLRSPRHTPDFHAACRARECIHEALPHSVSMAQLESACGRDRWSLSRDFKWFFGTSPYRYLSLRRLDSARQQMLLGQSLADCADAAGFADQSHMTRQFVRTFGLPPARWLQTVNVHDRSRP